MKINNEEAGLHRQAGFTLVELLVVIAIIVILAGAAIVVINPQAQKAKANEALMRANLSKICMALAGCGSLYDTPDKCDSFTEIGVNNPAGNPVGSSYSVLYYASGNYVYANGYQNGNGSVDCRWVCIYDFDDGTFTKPYHCSTCGTCVVN